MEKDLTSITHDQIILIVATGVFTLLFAVGAVISILHYKKEKRVSTMVGIIFLTVVTAFLAVGFFLTLNIIEEERYAKRYEDVVTISEEYFEGYQESSRKERYVAYHHYILTTDGRQFELDKDFFDYVREQTTDKFKIVYLNRDSSYEGSKGEYSGYIEKIYLVNEGL